MRKWIGIGACAAVVVLAVSVFALQRTSSDTAANGGSVAQVAGTASSGAGCGTGASGCGGGSSSGCGGGSGGCGTSAGTPQEAKARLESIQAYLAEYYAKALGTSEVTVKVNDFGCHQEATVLQGQQLVDTLSISGNKITRISG